MDVAERIENRQNDSDRAILALSSANQRQDASATLTMTADETAKQWLEKMATLRVDPARGVAPHKPLLLLVVLDMADEGKLQGSILHRDGDLAFRFSSYWTIVANRRRTRPDVRLPFYHLKTSGVWQLFDAAGNPAEYRESAVLAHINVNFLHCLNDAEFRNLARRVLISKYFEPEERRFLYSLVNIEVPPDDIIAADAARFMPPEETRQRRDAKFSVRVLPAYNYTCALTRYRMIAIDGTTALDAAHIQQFKQGGACQPTNGIALSKTAHWLFDRGFWSLSDDCRILVASHLFEEAGETAHLLKQRAGTTIMFPVNPAYMPDHTSLRWHRERHKFL